MRQRGQQTVSGGDADAERTPRSRGPTAEPFRRIDGDDVLRAKLRPLCRLGWGDIWEDRLHGHRVGVLDATVADHVARAVGDLRPSLLVNDPPYNVVVGGKSTYHLSRQPLSRYLEFSRKWVHNCAAVMAADAHFYVWLGADYRNGFQPLPDFMLLMREFDEFTARNFITLRNQRGYGTQKNWMWLRQELLHYVHGHPDFTVVYTDVPKVLRGYYKIVEGKRVENLERSRSGTLRPGNVWIDIQQVFYRLEENVPGCYAQKPLKAIERILSSSSEEGDIVLDCFAHSGTTLLAAERTGRRAITFDVDPIFAELTIRRLEHFRQTGRTGWQWHNPFPEAGEWNDAAATASKGRHIP